MKKEIKRVPTDLLDDLSIYCHFLKENNLSFSEIANIIRKDRTTVMYHLERYSNLSKFNKVFKLKIKNFSEPKFLKEYRKTGNLNPFFRGILEMPERMNDNNEEVGKIVNLVTKFNYNKIQRVINFCELLNSK